MTIRIIGFVESTHANALPGFIRVSVQIPGADGVSPFVFFVPNEQDTEWVAGRTVEITAHVYQYTRIGT